MLRDRLWTIGVIAGGLIILFAPIAFGDLQLDAPLYAWMGKRIAVTGEWWILAHDYPGKEGYFNKPPLMFWLMAGYMQVFGQNIIAARLASGTFHLLAAAALYWLVRQRAVHWAACSVVGVFFAHLLMQSTVMEVRLDGGLVLSALLASIGVIKVIGEKREHAKPFHDITETDAERHKRWLTGYAIIGIGIALGLLVRGGLAWLALPVLLLTAALRKRWDPLMYWRGWIVAAVPVLVLVVPWWIWQLTYWGDITIKMQAWDGIGQHLKDKQNHSILKLFTYYWKALGENFFLWIPVLIGGGVVLGLRRRWSTLQSVAVAWLVVVFVVLHMTMLRAARYMMIMYPWLALIVTIGFTQSNWGMRRFWRRHGWWLVMLVCIVLTTGAHLQVRLTGEGIGSVIETDLPEVLQILRNETGHDPKQFPPTRPAVWVSKQSWDDRVAGLQFYSGLNAFPLEHVEWRGGLRAGDYFADLHLQRQRARIKRGEAEPGSIDLGPDLPDDLRLELLHEGERWRLYRIERVVTPSTKPID